MVMGGHVWGFILALHRYLFEKKEVEFLLYVARLRAPSVI